MQTITREPDTDQVKKVVFNSNVRTSSTWLNSARDYIYGHDRNGNGFLDWAGLKGRALEDIEDAFARANRSRSKEDAMDLWKKVNLVWLDRSETITNDVRSSLIDRTRNISSEEEAKRIARESLAYHVDYYKHQLLKYYGRYSATAPNAGETISEYIKNIDRLEERYGDLIRHKENTEEYDKELRKTMKDLDNAQEEIEKYMYDLRRIVKPENVKGSGLMFFYDSLMHMNRMHGERNYSDDPMWDHMYMLALNAWKGHYLDEPKLEPPPLLWKDRPGDDREFRSPPPPLWKDEDDFVFKSPPPPPEPTAKEKVDERSPAEETTERETDDTRIRQEQREPPYIEIIPPERYKPSGPIIDTDVLSTLPSEDPTAKVSKPANDETNIADRVLEKNVFLPSIIPKKGDSVTFEFTGRGHIEYNARTFLVKETMHDNNQLLDLNIAKDSQVYKDIVEHLSSGFPKTLRITRLDDNGDEMHSAKAYKVEAVDDAAKSGSDGTAENRKA